MKKGGPMEDRLIARLTRGWPGRGALAGRVVAGVGDDCAVLRAPAGGAWMLLKTDAVVEGVHFLAAAAPSWIGWKAVARCVSDIAAMGGEPEAAVVTIGCPAPADARRLGAVYRGVNRCAAAHGVALVGGETTRAPALFVSVAMTGRVAPGEMVLRSGARAGDRIFVTGKLGGSGGGRHLRFTPRLREARWLVTRFKPTAMMDISDGLAADLPRLCRASGAGCVVDAEAVPRGRGCSLGQAVGEGEDFELLFTVARGRAAALRKAWPFRLALSEIGGITRGRAPLGLFGAHGHDHFQGA